MCDEFQSKKLSVNDISKDQDVENDFIIIGGFYAEGLSRLDQLTKHDWANILLAEFPQLSTDIIDHYYPIALETLCNTLIKEDLKSRYNTQLVKRRARQYIDALANSEKLYDINEQYLNFFFGQLLWVSRILTDDNPERVSQILDHPLNYDIFLNKEEWREVAIQLKQLQVWFIEACKALSENK